VDGAFSISPDAPGTLTVPDEYPSLMFQPNTPLASGTTYEVTISTSLQSQRGATLPEPHRFQFTTVGW